MRPNSTISSGLVGGVPPTCCRAGVVHSVVHDGAGHAQVPTCHPVGAQQATRLGDEHGQVELIAGIGGANFGGGLAAQPTTTMPTLITIAMSNAINAAGTTTTRRRGAHTRATRAPQPACRSRGVPRRHPAGHGELVRGLQRRRRQAGGEQPTTETCLCSCRPVSSARARPPPWPAHPRGTNNAAPKPHASTRRPSPASADTGLASRWRSSQLAIGNGNGITVLAVMEARRHGIRRPSATAKPRPMMTAIAPARNHILEMAICLRW